MIAQRSKCKLKWLAAAAVALAIGITTAQEPQSGGTVVFGIQTEPDLWAPHRATAAQTFQFTNLLYDTLLVMDFDVATIHPHIATEYDVSDDGLIYTFTLRDDVLFHSGRPMTAEDWKWTFDYHLAEESGSLHAWRLGTVASIEAPDDTTLIVTLSEPNSELLNQLTMSFLAVLDREAIEEYGDDYGILYAGGTGPFKWESWTPGEDLVVVRNEDYTWGPPIHENTGPAYVERVVRRVVPEQTTLLFDVELGNIDIMISVPAEEIDRLASVPGIRMVETSPRPSLDFLGLKSSRPLMGDSNVRRAISYAIDRQELVETIWFGYANVAPGIVLEQTPGFAPDADWAFDDPEAAIELLEGSGWQVGADGIRVKDGDRLALTFLAIASPRNEQLGLALRQQLEAVGIELNLNLMDGNIFWGESRNDTYDIFVLDYGFNSALDILHNYFHSENMPAPNRTAYADDHLDSLLDNATVAVSMEERDALIREVQEIVAEQALFVPLINVQYFYSAADRVHDFRPHGQYLISVGSFLDTWVE